MQGASPVFRFPSKWLLEHGKKSFHFSSIKNQPLTIGHVKRGTNAAQNDKNKHSQLII